MNKKRIIYQSERIPTTNVSPYELIFPIVRFDKDKGPLEFIGTCFPIMEIPILVTAAHLYKPFSDLKKQLDTPEILRKTIHYNMEEMIYAVVMPTGLNQGVYPIDKISFYADHDLAFISIKTEENFMLPYFFPIKEKVNIGEKIFHIGYPENLNCIIKADKTDVHLALHESSGEIAELYPTGRDIGRCWFPSFKTTGSIPGGFSGGPVLSADKLSVCGINSFSLEPDEDNAVAYSISSILDENIEFEGFKVFSKSQKKEISLDKIPIRTLIDFGLIRLR